MSPRYVIRYAEEQYELWDTMNETCLLMFPYIDTEDDEHGRPTISTLPTLQLGRVCALLNELSRGES